MVFAATLPPVIQIPINQPVIWAYVRKRQQIEEEVTAEEALAPTGYMDRDARARKKTEERIIKLKKTQERRVNQKNAKALKECEVTLQLHEAHHQDGDNTLARDAADIEYKWDT
ncbi:hypothetical protein JB92DRAFT_2834523 [Gautieria morchelliformis]|nr:hypothetical protein JB92DRAFT_2834523 [Gautieria morchelliformis]